MDNCKELEYQESRQLEALKMYSSLMRADSRAQMVKGSVVLGLATFWPQILSRDTDLKLSLIGGTLALIVSSFGFFWYAGKLIKAHYQCGEMVLDMHTRKSPIPDFEARIDRELKIFKKREVKIVISLAKLAAFAGLILYVVDFCRSY